MQHTLDEADKRVKKPSCKVLIPSSTSSESESDDAHQRESVDDVHRNDQEVNFSIPSPPPSPTSTSVPITIAPCPPPITSQPLTSIPLQYPIFTITTITTTTTTSGPFVDFNGESDDDTFVTQRHIRALTEKLESLISSSSQAYSEAVVKGMLATLMKEHVANLAKANKAVEDSTTSCLQATEKVDKLISETNTFMTEIHTTTESNASKENEAITKLRTSLRTKRENLEKLRIDITTNNTAFQTSMSSCLSKFQDDLVVEIKIMDKLAL
ncbi:unnamed protein product [Lactuca saligna]|uniref:Uncharacterized protein n=1 Tax=Lactuca saligna TaxID=75948 RepID=A0AA35Z275_LACSI|nr:unnamed protein product [Lactuca saligna]